MHTIYRNVIKTSKRQWIANQVTFPFPVSPVSADAEFII